MKLVRPPQRYSPQIEAQRNVSIEKADAENRKKGRDVELGDGERLVMKSPDGTRWSVTVSNTGTLEVNAL